MGSIVALLAGWGVVAKHYYQSPEPLALYQRVSGLMTEPLPNTPPPEAPPQQTAEFWVQALHDLAQPVQALALFAERLRRLDVGPQAAQVVEHVGSGVQELQRVLQSLVQVAQMDPGQLVAQAQAVPVDSLLARVRSHTDTLALRRGEGQPSDLRWRSQGQQVLADPDLLGRLLLLLTEHALAQAQGAGVLIAWRSHSAQNVVRLELWWSRAGLNVPALKVAPGGHPGVNALAWAGAMPARYGGEKEGGLALYAAQRLAQLLRSPLEMRSAPRGLACLSLRLPAAISDAA
jgi:K+-sensing histidine kinase KdpD